MLLAGELWFWGDGWGNVAELIFVSVLACWVVLASYGMFWYNIMAG